ncbi:hypothetical protein HDU79_007169 [Rhizoclosmatium sp. JEL0117]|nr:hypothetical protein HDU79_007169 [Rhizoclosmatium sp. JEL0117]
MSALTVPQPIFVQDSMPIKPPHKVNEDRDIDDYFDEEDDYEDDFYQSSIGQGQSGRNKRQTGTTMKRCNKNVK